MPTIGECDSAMDPVWVLLPSFLLTKMFTAIVAIDVFLSVGTRGSVKIIVDLVMDEAKMQK